jgi:hypothetical protein
MNKNYLVDILSLKAFMISAISGFILHFMNPKNTILFARHIWYGIHLWSSIIFIILMIIHFVQHFNWIIVMTKNMFACKNKKTEARK